MRRITAKMASAAASWKPATRSVVPFRPPRYRVVPGDRHVRRLGHRSSGTVISVGAERSSPHRPHGERSRRMASRSMCGRISARSSADRPRPSRALGRDALAEQGVDEGGLAGVELANHDEQEKLVVALKQIQEQGGGADKAALLHRYSAVFDAFLERGGQGGAPRWGSLKVTTTPEDRVMTT